MNHQRPFSLRNRRVLLGRSLPLAVLTVLTAYCLLPTAFQSERYRNAERHR